MYIVIRLTINPDTSGNSNTLAATMIRISCSNNHISHTMISNSHLSRNKIINSGLTMTLHYPNTTTTVLKSMLEKISQLS
jgi:hypothetical protein